MVRTTPAVRARTAALMSGCALALVLAAAPERAQAQAFQGSAAVVPGAGSATVTTGSGTTTVDVGAAQTVINWTPTDTSTSGTINFLPNGTTAAFQSSSLKDYTVLNRILPGGTAKIGLNGNIISSVSDSAGGQSAGGNVWFYTPNGFVIGPSATISVGGLVMTTNDIVFGAANTGGDTLTDANGKVLFRGNAGSLAGIDIQPGAEIFGNNASSYVALVAPVIKQGGDVSADRSIAYVAAESVDLGINAGLFDITVNTGTTDANGIVHYGSTSGSTSTGYTDTKAISMVAVPKNTALTMLLSGSIGYSAASSYYDDGSAIVLTAGNTPGQDAGIKITNATFDNRLNASATGDILVSPDAPGPFDEVGGSTLFRSYATLSGDRSVTVSAGLGATITALQGLNLYSNGTAPGTGGKVEVNALAGDAFFGAGQVNVSGYLSADASAYGDTSTDGTTGLDAHAGSIALNAFGGTISADSVSLYSRGYGGSGTALGGDGYGGTIDLVAGYGGTINAPYIYATADGDGGYAYDPGNPTPTGRGGVGHGGSITVKDEGTALGTDTLGGTFAGTPYLTLRATGTGGNVETSGSGRGGDAFGGTIDIAFTRNSQTLSQISAYAEAYDGDIALDPVGGDISLLVDGGITVDIFNGLDLYANAIAAINGPAGGFAKGGTIDLAVQGESALNVEGSATLEARADINAAFGVDIASTPDLTGGIISVTADGGSFQASNFTADVEAVNVGAATSGGFAKGGSITLTADNGGSIAAIAAPETNTGYFTASAQAFGSSAASPTVATGGTIHLVAQNGGSISAPNQSIELDAMARPGYFEDYSGSTGVAATGGTITVDILGSTFDSILYANAYGAGGDATDTGGAGTGGTINLNASQGGSLIATLNTDATGTGGNATGTGTGGIGRGGNIALNAIGGTIGTDYFSLEAEGYGGSGLVAGGDGYGGKIDLLSALGGTISASGLYAYAGADGGQSYDYSNPDPTGVGGTAHGGTITVKDQLATNDALGGTYALSTLYLDTTGIGGNVETFGQGRGGDAFGGKVDIAFTGHDQTIDSLYAYANAQDGDVAFDPMAGDVSMLVGGGVTVNLSYLTLRADALAGVNGPQGDFVKGGTVALDVNGGATLSVYNTANLSARADVDNGFGSVTIDSTPDATGGMISVNADNGTFVAQDLYADVGTNNYGANVSAGFSHAGTIKFTAANGGAISAVPDIEVGGGFFQLLAEAYGTNGASTNLVTGGDITVSALSGGTISAPGQSLELLADALPGYSYDYSGNGATAQGGSITIDAIGGTIAAPSINAIVDGQGAAADNNAGSGTGGSIAVKVQQGGTLEGALYASAQGKGADSYVEGAGGVGTGGALTFASDSTAGFTNFALDYDGSGRGGEAQVGQGGDAYGGTARIDVLGGDISWDHATFDVGATGAYSFNPEAIAGGAYGNTDGAGFHVGEGANFQLGYLDLSGVANADANGSEYSANGANLDVLVDGGAHLSTQGLYLDASASMSFGDVSTSDILTTPDAYAGRASVIADGGSIETYTLDLQANGQTSGAITTAGEAHGGTAQLGAINGGSFTLLGGGEGTFIRIEALGLGGEGPSAADAFGGTATAFTAGGSISSAFPLRVSADAFAGDFSGSFEGSDIPSNGFNATGGTASVEMRTGGTGGSISTVNVSVSAEGRANGGPAVRGSGGIGTGGTAFVSVAQGTLDVAPGFQGFGDISISAEGVGGLATENTSGGAAFVSGAGNGGSASLILSGGTLNTTAVELSAVGSGALGDAFTDGATPSIAADGTGGTALLQVSGGTLNDSGGFTIDASGYGGSGAYNPNTGAGGTGGRGVGGTATVISPDGSTGTANIATDLLLYASGSGGSGGFSAGGTRGAGGDGLGGTASTELADLAFTIDGVTLDAGGFAGSGATGAGSGKGGLASFALVDSTAGTITPRLLGRLTLAASSSGNGSATGGMTEFVSQVGNTGSALAITGNFIATGDGSIAPSGYGFNGAISGAPVTVGGIALITTPGDANLSITAPGALDVTGNFTVDVGGTFTSTGAISTQADASIQAPDGITMSDLSAGGTTLLEAINGPVTVSHDLRSTGPVTVYGTAVNLVSLGALSFADADAIMGDLSIQTAGNLDLVTVDATGAVTLTSTGGNVHTTGAVNGTDLTFIAGGNVTSDTVLSANGNLTVDAGGTFTTSGGTASATGNVSLSAGAGLNLNSVVSGGTTLLKSTGGAVTIASLTSAGAVTARGRSVSIVSPGALTFADAQATTGGLTIQTAGNLALAQASASGALNLASTAGSVTGTSPGAVSAGGNVTVSGRNGIGFGTLTSGGTTSLTSSNGIISVLALTSPGLVTASGTAISIASPGALGFANAQATGGSLQITTAGNLALQQASATGAIALTSTGGAISGTGSVTAGGQVVADGKTGITFASLSSGDATTLTATNGTISIASLTSVAPVSATAQGIGITSPGALDFTNAQATAGSLTLKTAGDLRLFNTAGATGAVSLASTGGGVYGTGSIASGGIFSANGATAVGLNAVSSGGTTHLSSANGYVDVASLTSTGAVTVSGRDYVSIISPRALSFANATVTAGPLSIQTADDLAFAQGSASGQVTLTSTGGAISGAGPISGGSIVVNGQTGVALGSLTSGSSTLLSASNGAVQVTDLNSAGAVSATGRAIDIGSTGALTFNQLDATAGNVRVQTAGNLATGAVNATGSITLISTGGSLATGGALNGVGITLSSFNNLTLNQSLSTSGAMSLTSTNGAISATNPLSAGGTFSASGRNGVALGTVSSGGTTTLTATNGTVQVTGLSSTGAVTASGRAVDIASPGALTFAGLDATAGNVRVQTAGNLATGAVNATGSITLISTGGSLSTGGALNGVGITLSAFDNLTLNQALATTGAVSLTSTNGAVAAANAVNAGANLAVSGRTGITLGTVTSGGTTSFASGGAIAVSALTSTGAVTATGSSIALGSPGTLNVTSAQATAGNLSIGAAGGLTVGTASATGTAAFTAGGTLRNTGLVTAAGLGLTGANVVADGELRSSAGLTLNAAQLLTLNALAAGTTVSAMSGDIAIGTSGQLGRRGLTTALTIADQSPSRPMFIGGTGQSGEFSLDKAEAARLYADKSITIAQAVGTQSTPGTVTIGDLAMAFGDTANIGSGGLLKVDAVGTVQVNGAVALTTVSNADRFSIDPTKIEVIAGSGSILMKNASGALMGELDLVGGSIAIADRTTLDTIAGLSDFAAISALLDNPGPAGPAGGTIQAGTISLVSGGPIYIQNAGATTKYEDRRGFFANALNISTESSTPQVAINGVIAGTSGDLTGLDTAQGVTINQVNATQIPFGATITINGCPAGVNCGIPDYIFGGLSNDELEPPVGGEEAVSGPASQMIQVEETQPLITPPLVDEPITGVGNDDLWQVKCDPADDKSPCPAEGGKEGTK